MFNRKKKIKLTENELRRSVIASMYILSDGMEWHVAGKEEESNPLVMASPEEIADVLVVTFFGSPSSEDSSTSTS